jgi:hypothetical protein
MTFLKRPLEFYGHNTDGQHNWDAILLRQHCPFLNRQCVKQRKSDPQQTIGACAVGYKGNSLIICPHRFLHRQQIFLDAVPLLRAGQQFFVVPEISMPGGSVDYFVVSMQGDEIVDFAGIEIQTLDTTGTGGIWQAREDLRKSTLGASYSYGINWKMSAKTILMQLHHEGPSFEALGKKLLLVAQDAFFDYIRREFRATQVHPAAAHDAVHVHTYNCVLLNRGLQVVLDARWSTGVRGVEEMLSLGRSPKVSEEEIIRRIEARLSEGFQLVTAG